MDCKMVVAMAGFVVDSSAPGQELQSADYLADEMAASLVGKQEYKMVDKPVAWLAVQLDGPMVEKLE